MSKQWLVETENQILQIQQDRDSLAQEHEQLGRALAAKDEELDHWEAVLQSYRRRQELESPQPTLFLQERNIDNLSWREIVLLVSGENDSQIPMKQVTTLLRGKVSNPDHAASAAYSTVKRLVKQGKVVKVRPGLYKWVNGVNPT